MATNHNLPEQVAGKLFRRDLYYRLCAHEIHIPPLRERPEDIPLLVEHFCAEAAQIHRKPQPKVAASTLSRLLGWSYPGNVRELRAMIFDAVARHGEGELTAQSFGNNKLTVPEHHGQQTADRKPGLAIDTIFGHFPTLHEIEEYLIDAALRRSSGNINLAAGMLGITRQTIANRQKSAGKPPKAVRTSADTQITGNLFECNG
jgi:two-component system, NtrC family, response regulator HydG